MGLARYLDKKQDGRRIAKAEEILYLCYLAVIVWYQYLFSTMFQISWPAHWDLMLRFLGYGLVFFKILMDDRWDWEEIVFACLIIAGFYGSWKTEHSLDLIYGLILILGAKNISFDKIAKVYLAVQIPSILVTVYCSLHGYIAYLTYDYGNGRIAHAFGSIYRTDFCAHLFFLACCMIWISRKKIWYAEGIFVLWLAWFVDRYCAARNSTICLLLLGCGALAIQGTRDIRSWLQKRKKTGTKKKAAVWVRVVLFCVCFSTPVFAAASVLASRFFRADVTWMARLDTLLSSRLRLGKEGFDRYNVTLFGQYVQQIGAGGQTDPGQTYFFLDVSYVNMLLRLGIVFFAAVVLIYFISSLKAWKSRDYVCVFILFLAALHCCVEHHMAELSYDMFLLLPFAETGWKKSRLFIGSRRNGKKRLLAHIVSGTEDD